MPLLAHSLVRFLMRSAVRRPFVVVHSDIFSAILRSGWIYLIGTAFFFFSALRDLSTGRTRPMYRTVARAENKFSYWFSIGQSVVVGIGCLIAFVYLIQRKP
jgi:hypothetical protein